MAWNEFVPWTDLAMVEQDLIISRALVNIYSDDFLKDQLAFRGGTALHKLYLTPQIRYSEDIDLVQIFQVQLNQFLKNLENFLIGCLTRTPNRRNIITLCTLEWNQNFLQYKRSV